jgi:hypothetical protein
MDSENTIPTTYTFAHTPRLCISCHVMSRHVLCDVTRHSCIHTPDQLLLKLQSTIAFVATPNSARVSISSCEPVLCQLANSPFPLISPVKCPRGTISLEWQSFLNTASLHQTQIPQHYTGAASTHPLNPASPASSSACAPPAPHSPPPMSAHAIARHRQRRQEAPSTLSAPCSACHSRRRPAT